MFANKNILAVCVKSSKMPNQASTVADIESLKEVGRAHTSEITTLDKKQNEMAQIGTTHLVPIMNDYDLLPCMNFQFGANPGHINIGKDAYRAKFHKGYDGCWMGCPMACAHCVKDFVPVTGPFKGQKVWVDGPEYETIAGCGSNLGVCPLYFFSKVIRFLMLISSWKLTSIAMPMAWIQSAMARDLLL